MHLVNMLCHKLRQTQRNNTDETVSILNITREENYVCTNCFVPSGKFLLNSGTYWDKIIFFLHFCKNIPLGTGSQVNEKKRI